MSSRGNLLLAISALGLALGCPACDDNDKGGSSKSEKASQPLASNTAGEVALADGAKLKVPLWAIPLDAKGGSTAVEFSVERTDQEPTPPSGETAASAVYVFGPGHFTFAMPVEVVIPVDGNPNAEDVRIYRINPDTQKPERYSATYDPSTKTASAQTYTLSSWFAATGSADHAAGAFRISNTSADSWINVCVTQRTLKYPDEEAEFPSHPIAAAPAGTVGWSSTVRWFLPQGTYTLCVESQKQGTISTPPGKPAHIVVADQVLDQPWTNSDPKTKDLSYGALTSATDGPCDCRPQASGAAQVYFNGNIDAVFNKPTAPTVFTTERCTFISRIVTYHWNSSAGKTPGTISLTSGDGTSYGPWQASGTPGQGGVVDAYWNCFPNLLLPAGTYTIVDSDPDTWSQNSGTNGTGHGWVEGTPAECAGGSAPGCSDPGVKCKALSECCPKITDAPQAKAQCEQVASGCKESDCGIVLTGSLGLAYCGS